MRVILPKLTVLELDDDMHVNFVSNKSHDVTPNPTVPLTTISVSIAYRLADVRTCFNVVQVSARFAERLTNISALCWYSEGDMSCLSTTA